MVIQSLSIIDNAWQDFIINGRIGDHSISPDILESWQRCYESGVDPQDGTCYHLLNQTELNDLLNKRKYLIEIARPFMLNLYEFVKGSGLADERGFIMEAFGDEDTLDEAKTINFVKGADWTEKSVGTNAIGTAIVLKKPLQTVGAEHYCRKHHVWTCSASPIFDKNGQMIGVLDMSGPLKWVHKHTLGMVVAAVQAITDQMGIQKKNQELKMTNNRLTEIFRTMSDGVIIINHQGVVMQINPVAEQIIGNPARELIGKSIKDILGRGIPAFEKALNRHESYSDAEVLVDTADGRIHCLSSGVPIIDEEGNFTGAVILVRPMEKVQNLVNRFSGAQAVFHFKDVIGESPEMAEVVRQASLAASGNSNILLEGESGTGKEVVAQAIHNRSTRRKGPFVAVNCGAIPRELIGSELFGYSEGAFTGAKRGGRPGKFELASGGTLFLDEIGDMPLEQQVALLRVLQDKKITRIGDDKIIPVDFRVVCATNKCLLDEIEKGTFRQDLYYRVNVVSLNIPPLRSHPEDIPALFEHFMQIIGGTSRRQCVDIDPQVIECLKQYRWPGNARELQNVVERLINMAEGGRIGVEHLPTSIYRPSVDKSAPSPAAINSSGRVNSAREKRKQYWAASESQEITDLLAKHRGNISEVAKDMRVSRNTVYRKMRQYNIN
ncbi:MAG: sigma-54-dependent Fis family transcriptional regulator [Firmicutes bacterium]|nr:sigma-54-dependent Fis family transcriptional regulator [Bacillota bacterium]